MDVKSYYYCAQAIQLWLLLSLPKCILAQFSSNESSGFVTGVSSYVTTFTVTQSGDQELIYPDQTSFTGFEVTGPSTAVVTVYPHDNADGVSDLAAVDTAVSTVKVDSGILTLDVADGTTYSSLQVVGPTTVTITAGKPWYGTLCPFQVNGICASADPQASDASAAGTGIISDDTSDDVTGAVVYGTGKEAYTESYTGRPGIATLTITATDAQVVVLPEKSLDFSTVTITGPTTLTASVFTNSDEQPAIYNASDPFTITTAVEQGTEYFEIYEASSYSIVSLTGPITATVTGVVPFDGPLAIQAASGVGDASNPHCKQTTASFDFRSKHEVTLKYYITSLNAGQTFSTTQCILGGLKCSNVGYTGPTLVYITTTSTLIEPYVEHDIYPSTTTASAEEPQISGTVVKVRELPVRRDASTLVESGFTYISPSIYIAFPMITAFDKCGQLGKVHNTTLGFPPDEISTVVYFRSSDDPVVTSIYPFDPEYAQCPPLSLGTSHWTVLASSGQGYNPIISPPANLTRIDPEWNACYVAGFQGNDPPYALGPASNLSPNPTPVDPVVSTTPALPANDNATPQSVETSTTMFNPSQPSLAFSPPQSQDTGPAVPPTAATATMSSKDPATSSPAASADPGSSNDLIAPPSEQNEPSVQPSITIDGSQEQPASTQAISDTFGTIPSSALGTSGSESTDDPKQQPDNSGLGGIIYSAFGKIPGTPTASVPTISVGTLTQISDGHTSVPPVTTTLPPSQAFANSPQENITINEHTIAVASNVVSYDGTTLLPGGVGQVIDGTSISLGVSGHLAIGSSTLTFDSSTAAGVMTIAGNIITPNPSGFTLTNGLTVSPGGSAVTVEGTAVSLAPNGDLFVGSTSIALSSTLNSVTLTPSSGIGDVFTGGATASRIPFVLRRHIIAAMTMMVSGLSMWI